MDVDNQPTATNPGIQVLQLVVHRPMSELDWLNQYLKTSCERYVAREHDPDEGCTRVHCHFAIEYKYSKQSLQKCLNKNGINGSDNYGILSVCQETKVKYDFKILSSYIIKGIVNDTVRYSGVSSDFIQAISVNGNDYKKDRESRKKDKGNEWEQLKKDAIKHFNHAHYTFDNVRAYVMRWYYVRDGLMPFAPTYKRYASTLYYVLCERDSTSKCLTTAMEEIMDKFY